MTLSESETPQHVFVGSWRDSIPPIAGVMTVRFRASPNVGEVFYGTTTVRQRELGMMSSFLVLDRASFIDLTASPTLAPTQTPPGDIYAVDTCGC
jgi:hypothetical protein